MDFINFLSRPEFNFWQDHFRRVLTQRSNPKRHGDLNDWLAIIDLLPDVLPSSMDFGEDIVRIGSRSDLSDEQYTSLQQALRSLCPWRKGPFDLFSVIIDTEWRSDLKWQRLKPHISELTDRHILDVGCGSGYHCWRMLGTGAAYVLGIDPSMRFLMQHTAINKYAQSHRFDFLPIGIEDMPADMPVFDTVFSMGVLYHRRHPIDHLVELYQLMKNGAELVLESLIVDTADNGMLQPTNRYAQMRNVWNIMTVKKIESLLNQAGFESVRCVDQNVTSLHEQRQTDWMNFHSLSNFLDPSDQSKTIEGYPAPKRGLFIARKPQ